MATFVAPPCQQSLVAPSLPPHLAPGESGFWQGFRYYLLVEPLCASKVRFDTNMVPKWYHMYE